MPSGVFQIKPKIQIPKNNLVSLTSCRCHACNRHSRLVDPSVTLEPFWVASVRRGPTIFPLQPDWYPCPPLSLTGIQAGQTQPHSKTRMLSPWESETAFVDLTASH